MLIWMPSREVHCNTLIFPPEIISDWRSTVNTKKWRSVLSFDKHVLCLPFSRSHVEYQIRITAEMVLVLGIKLTMGTMAPSELVSRHPSSDLVALCYTSVEYRIQIRISGVVGSGYRRAQRLYKEHITKRGIIIITSFSLLRGEWRGYRA